MVSNPIPESTDFSKEGGLLFVPSSDRGGQSKEGADFVRGSEFLAEKHNLGEATRQIVDCAASGAVEEHESATDFANNPLKNVIEGSHEEGQVFELGLDEETPRRQRGQYAILLQDGCEVVNVALKLLQGRDDLCEGQMLYKQRT